jgi:type VI secretion system secreted protein Hcp
MAYDSFLKIEGIKGESLDSKHKDEIEVLSFSWGATQAGAFGGGGGTGKVSAQDFNFVLKIDKSSPLLFKYVATGAHLKEAVLTLRKAGKDQVDYLKYKFTDILISSFSPSTRAQSTGPAPHLGGGVPGAIGGVIQATTGAGGDEVAMAGSGLRAAQVEYSVLSADGEWISFNFDFAENRLT